MKYGIKAYLPINRNEAMKAQFMSARTAMGYRNNTPTNVLLAESKLLSITNRARFLARNGQYGQDCK